MEILGIALASGCCPSWSVYCQNRCGDDYSEVLRGLMEEGERALDKNELK